MDMFWSGISGKYKEPWYDRVLHVVGGLLILGGFVAGAILLLLEQWKHECSSADLRFDLNFTQSRRCFANRPKVNEFYKKGCQEKSSASAEAGEFLVIQPTGVSLRWRGLAFDSLSLDSLVDGMSHQV